MGVGDGLRRGQGRRAGREMEDQPGPGRNFLFVKVTQADGNLLWSAPVSIKVRMEGS